MRLEKRLGESDPDIGLLGELTESPGVPARQSTHIGIHMQQVFVIEQLSLAALGSPDPLCMASIPRRSRVPLGHREKLLVDYPRSRWL